MTATALQYVTATQIAEMLSTSTRSIWRMVACGRLPRPIYLGRKSPRWRLAEVESALEKLK